MLKERNYKTDLSSKVLEESMSKKGISLYKSLSSTLDSFDNLFCRRCMVRDFFCLSGIICLGKLE